MTRPTPAAPTSVLPTRNYAGGGLVPGASRGARSRLQRRPSARSGRNSHQGTDAGNSWRAARERTGIEFGTGCRVGQVDATPSQLAGKGVLASEEAVVLSNARNLQSVEAGFEVVRR